jgi:hypothetical protein
MADPEDSREELRQARRLAALARSASVSARVRSQTASEADRVGELRLLIERILARHGEAEAEPRPDAGEGSHPPPEQPHRRAYEAHLEAARRHREAAQRFQALREHGAAAEHLRAAEAEMEQAAAELGMCR